MTELLFSNYCLSLTHTLKVMISECFWLHIQLGVIAIRDNYKTICMLLNNIAFTFYLFQIKNLGNASSRLVFSYYIQIYLCPFLFFFILNFSFSLLDGFHFVLFSIYLFNFPQINLSEIEDN